MLQDVIDSPVLRRRLRDGPAGDHIDSYCDLLLRRGYQRISIDSRVRQLAGLTDWMRTAGFDITRFAEGVEACRTHLELHPRARYARGPNEDSLIAGSLFLRFLREQGVLPRPTPEPSVTDRWPVLAEFRSWMVQHRGARESTIDIYQYTLLDLFAVLGDAPGDYTAGRLRDFVLDRARPHGISRAKQTVTALRAYLRFLTATGLCRSDLVDAMPNFASWRLASLPRFLEPADLQRVVDACVAEDATGLRDRAVVLLLCRLGLRAGDVSALGFSDIDWRNGRIAVRGKGHRQEWLPLPQEVGEALLRYLREGRTPLAVDRIFVRVNAPLGPLSRAAVTQVARSALRRAGINAPVNSAHVLRHSAATAMLRQGASLAAVGAVLRHRDPATTTHYAKVDLGLQREIAQPWPEVASC